jgi:hypothetical protein
MRIVALSDQHGYLPKIPPCDLLIIAGDVCPDGVGAFTAMQRPDRQKAWFDRHVRPWLAAAPATNKLLTWGNHDFCGQDCDFHQHSPSHASATELQVLVDEGVTVQTRDGAISVWATPWSNLFMDWAFMKPPGELEAVYARIPKGVDILVSHQPPYGYGDRYVHIDSGRVEHIGSRELLAAIERVRPKMVICGHIHDGHGRMEHDGIPIHNVSVVNEEYRLVHEPTVIDIAHA